LGNEVPTCAAWEVRPKYPPPLPAPLH
jgi:hypothetical protein